MVPFYSCINCASVSATTRSNDRGLIAQATERSNDLLVRLVAAVLTFGAGVMLSMVVTTGRATAQELEWATSASDTGNSVGLGIASDAAGHSYVTGYFHDTATFGAGEANETVLQAASTDVFVTKFAPDGSLIWATKVGGGPFGIGDGIAVDPDGNSYVTGYFQGMATFGQGEANETVLRGGDSTDAFVAKFTQDGTLQWAARAGGANESFSFGLGIAADPGGNSYVTGYFRGRSTFGAGEANETVLEAVSDSDVFVAKYAPDGKLVWATSAGGAKADLGFGIATDPLGNSYVAGYFTDSATLGEGQANETVLETAEAGERLSGFVAKYARDGTLVWAKSAAVADFSAALGVAADPRGNSYVIGTFEGMATFGAGEPNEAVLEAAADSDLFVAKYNRDGTLVWVTSAGGAGGSFGFSLGIATDHRGNSYVTGNFQGRVSFGAGEANETVLEAVNDSDMFVGLYADDGTLAWAKNACSAAGEAGAGEVATGPLGRSGFVTGYFSGRATFGAGELNQTVLRAGPRSEGFVARYLP